MTLLALTSTPKSLLASMGGWLGLAEAILPSTIFVTLFAITLDRVAPVIAASVVALGFTLLRLITRQPLTQAIAGLVGVGLAAFLTLREGGQAADYFLTGFYTNAAYLGVLAISVLIRWPLIGFVVGAFSGSLTNWRSDKAQFRLYTLVTLIWCSFFALRLLVQVPLYLAGEVTALGTARIVMGTPFYAVLLVVTWLLVRRRFGQGVDSNENKTSR